MGTRQNCVFADTCTQFFVSNGKTCFVEAVAHFTVAVFTLPDKVV